MGTELSAVYKDLLSSRTLEPVESLVMADGQGSVNKLANSEVGVWVSFRSSSILSLYDMKHFVPLLTMDYCTILPAQPEHQQVRYHMKMRCKS